MKRSMKTTLTATAALLLAGVALAPGASASQAATAGSCTSSGTALVLNLTGYEYDGDDTNTVRITLDGVAATVSFGTEFHYSSGPQDPTRAHMATFRVTTQERGSRSITQMYAAGAQACIR